MTRASSGIQQPYELIDVGAWTHPETLPVKTGSRDAQVIISPKISEFDFLVPGHQYRLKFSSSRAPEQFWNEILAHRLGTYIGISVPPTHLGYNSLTRQVGALSEYFYGHPNHPHQVFRHGGDILQGEVKNYDRRRGRKHNFHSIASWFKFLERNRLINEDWREYWAKAFLLDALMGNTDRHHDNWGAVWTTPRNGRLSVRLAPLFDNGTSMGYELPAKSFADLLDRVRLLRYVNRGTHQMLWRAEDARRLSHPHFLKKFYDEFPAQRKGILERLRISDRTISEVVLGLTKFRSPVPLSRARADFMIWLLKFRRDLLRHTLLHQLSAHCFARPHDLIVSDEAATFSSALADG